MRAAILPACLLFALSAMPAGAATLRPIPIQTYQWQHYEGQRGGMESYTPKGLGHQLVGQASQALVNGDEREAMAFARQVLSYSAMQPQDVANAQNILCIAHMRLGQLKEARRACDQAIALQADNWRFYNNRGLAHMLLGDMEAAVSDYRKALSLAPDAAQVQSNLNLAVARQRQGGATAEPVQ